MRNCLVGWVRLIIIRGIEENDRSRMRKKMRAIIKEKKHNTKFLGCGCGAIAYNTNTGVLRLVLHNRIEYRRSKDKFKRIYDNLIKTLKNSFIVEEK